MLLQMALFHSFLWLSSIPYGEGSGTPLQYSCLENPMGGGAWWAAVHGVTKSRTRLKWLSSSSSSRWHDFLMVSVTLEGYRTEWLHFHFSLSLIGEGNGNPLQCSCLENPRDGGAWLAAVYGVTQSRTRLKWLSSSSSSRWHDFLMVSVTLEGYHFVFWVLLLLLLLLLFKTLVFIHAIG